MQRTRIEPAQLGIFAVIAIAAYGVAKAFGVVGGEDDAPYLPEGIDAPNVSVPPTITAQHAQTLADRIYAAIYGDGTLWTGSTTENEDAVIAALAEAGNDADVLLIADKYGRRGGTWSTSGNLNLWGVVREYLSTSDIASINEYYRANGINIRF